MSKVRRPNNMQYAQEEGSCSLEFLPMLRGINLRVVIPFLPSLPIYKSYLIGSRKTISATIAAICAACG